MNWSPPHVMIDIRATAEKKGAKPQIWTLEAGSPDELRRAGPKVDGLEAGRAKIYLHGYPRPV